MQCLGAADRAAYLAGLLSAVPAADPRPTVAALSVTLAGATAATGAADLAGAAAALGAASGSVGQMASIDTWRAGVDAAVAALRSVDYSQVGVLDGIVASIAATPVSSVLASFTTLTTTLQTFQTDVRPVVRGSARAAQR